MCHTMHYLIIPCISFIFSFKLYSYIYCLVSELLDSMTEVLKASEKTPAVGASLHSHVPLRYASCTSSFLYLLCGMPSCKPCRVHSKRFDWLTMSCRSWSLSLAPFCHCNSTQGISCGWIYRSMRYLVLVKLLRKTSRM